LPKIATKFIAKSMESGMTRQVLSKQQKTFFQNPVTVSLEIERDFCVNFQDKKASAVLYFRAPKLYNWFDELIQDDLIFKILPSAPGLEIAEPVYLKSLNEKVQVNFQICDESRFREFLDQNNKTPSLAKISTEEMYLFNK
jgi:hypothetical protein